MPNRCRDWLDSRTSQAVGRGVALFLSVFTALGLLAELRSPGVELNLWWIDLRLLPGWMANLLLAAFAILPMIWSVRPRCGTRFRKVLAGLLALFILGTIGNAAAFWWLLARGEIHATVPLPLSLLFAGGLLLILRQVRTAEALVHRPVQLIACLACVVLFPLLQVVGFGKTDYRRPAETAVVFGARAYADGRPSDALADRVHTACQLYRDGLVRRLVFSGGPGDGAVHETESMRRLAMRLGVPETSILRDESGLSTAATVRNTRSLLSSGSTIAVSEFYHLPRIKLTYQLAGIDVRTVPAQPAHWARAWPIQSMVREVPAFWLYYARAVVGAA